MRSKLDSRRDHHAASLPTPAGAPTHSRHRHLRADAVHVYSYEDSPTKSSPCPREPKIDMPPRSIDDKSSVSEYLAEFHQKGYSDNAPPSPPPHSPPHTPPYPFPRPVECTIQRRPLVPFYSGILALSWIFAIHRRVSWAAFSAHGRASLLNYSSLFPAAPTHSPRAHAPCDPAGSSRGLCPHWTP